MTEPEADGFTISLTVDQVTGAASWQLPLRGHWDRTLDDVLLSEVTGTMRGAATATSAAGRITFWPRRMFGTIIGPSRIVLDVRSGEGRLVLDGVVPPPPYFGISLPGRLLGAGGDHEVTVSIDPAQLVGLWLALNRLLP